MLAATFLLIACEARMPTDVPSGGPAVAPSIAVSSPTPLPSVSVVPAPTPCVPGATSTSVQTLPSGSDQIWAYREGLIYAKIAQCRDVDELVRKYALLGPATHSSSPPFNEGERRVGLDRGFHIRVETGDEPALVERLAQWKDDFDYVSLVWYAYVCVLTCGPQPKIEPTSGPLGTQFVLQFCCWPAGTAVEKRFTRPDGQTTTLRDVARDNGTVPAGWGSGPRDPLGTYVVKVWGGGTAEVMRFRIE